MKIKYKIHATIHACSKEHYISDYKLYNREGIKYWENYINKYSISPFMILPFKKIKNKLFIYR